MKDPFITPPHATPIDISGLKLSGITSYQSLSNQETESILRARLKYFKVRAKTQFSLTEGYLKRVHLEMFGRIWDWAGVYRKTKTNVGVKPYLISTELLKVCDDFMFWVDEKWDDVEICARLHHRLVYIHPFENGNGRHARFVSDLYLFSKKLSIPSWPIDLSEESTSRAKYIRSLQKADRGDLNLLLSYIKEAILE